MLERRGRGRPEARAARIGAQRARHRRERAIAVHHHAELAVMDVDAGDLLLEPDDGSPAAKALDAAGRQVGRVLVLDPQRREGGEVIAGCFVGRRSGARRPGDDRPDQPRGGPVIARVDRHAERDRREIEGRLHARHLRIGRRRRRTRRGDCQDDRLQNDSPDSEHVRLSSKGDCVQSARETFS
jgi:hypothetical protein